MYLATADGGRAITDAVIETYEVVNIGRALAGEPPLAPKDGARFHFELPGSVQGFQGDHPSVTLDNVAEQSQAGTRTLAVRWTDERPDSPVVATTPTFIPPEAIAMPGTTRSWRRRRSIPVRRSGRVSSRIRATPVRSRPGC